MTRVGAGAAPSINGVTGDDDRAGLSPAFGGGAVTRWDQHVGADLLAQPLVFSDRARPGRR